jgi:hypothetical protein
MEADVAELADAIDLGSIARKGVEVRVLSSALEISLRARGQAGRRLLCKQEIVGSNPTGSTSCPAGFTNAVLALTVDLRA